MDNTNLPADVNSYLDKLWRSLRDGASERKIGIMQGSLDAFLLAGVISSVEHELWTRRSNTCPGHDDDEGGRSWCAYCGRINVPKEEGDSHDYEDVSRLDKRMRRKPGGRGLRDETRDDALWLVCTEFGWSPMRAADAIDEWVRVRS